VKGPPLRARGSFQCLVGNRVGENIFVSLVEGGSSAVPESVAEQSMDNTSTTIAALDQADEEILSYTVQ
jgi:hypothetical protein